MPDFKSRAVYRYEKDSYFTTIDFYDLFTE